MKRLLCPQCGTLLARIRNGSVLLCPQCNWYRAVVTGEAVSRQQIHEATRRFLAGGGTITRLPSRTATGIPTGRVSVDLAAIERRKGRRR